MVSLFFPPFFKPASFAGFFYSIKRDTARFASDTCYEQDVSGFACATCYEEKPLFERIGCVSQNYSFKKGFLDSLFMQIAKRKEYE